ncbi:MAG: GntR family transcriptional regulator [Anaerolineae bacterium]|nr:GntR family transcriptional regulator [Anaerolineae bacterium]
MGAALMHISSGDMKTRQELVTDAIRAAILRGRFRPGDRLDQTDLAEELNVSRSPVREALRILTAEDLVTHELLFVRQLLEGAAARRAVPHITPERLAKLMTIIKEAEASADMERVLALNNEFHTTVYSAFEQPYLLDEIQKIRNKIAPYNRLYLDSPGQKAAAWADHRRIYEACAAGDVERAVAETANHLARVFDGIIASLPSNGG